MAREKEKGWNETWEEKVSSSDNTEKTGAGKVGDLVVGLDPLPFVRSRSFPTLTFPYSIFPESTFPSKENENASLDDDYLCNQTFGQAGRLVWFACLPACHPESWPCICEGIVYWIGWRWWLVTRFISILSDLSTDFISFPLSVFFCPRVESGLQSEGNQVRQR